MGRKLEIVRSLIHRPKVLFLDEPTAGLDSPSRRGLWSYLERVRRESKTTILLTTHYLEEAEQADRICIIDHGRVVSYGTPAAIKADLVEEYVLVDTVDRPRASRRAWPPRAAVRRRWSVSDRARRPRNARRAEGD